MAILLDTNIVIGIRDGDVETVRRLRNQKGPTFMSILTLVELAGGLAVEPDVFARRQAGIALVRGTVPSLPFNEEIVGVYGRLVRSIGFSRRRVLDRLIAATALVHALPLATTNPADFRDIPDLALEVWPTAQ